MELVAIPQKKYPRWLWVIGFVLVAMLLFYTQVFASEIGGFLSEFLIDRAGVGDSTLTISRDHVGTSSFDIGQSAIVTTLPATGVDSTSGTLQGNVTDLNGFPSAFVYFEWGFDALYGNATAPQAVVALGGYNAAIGGLPSGTVVHFRAVSEADGTLYGVDQTFTTGTPPPSETGATFLRSMLPIGIAITLCFIVLRKGHRPIYMLAALMIGFVGFMLARYLLDAFNIW